MYYLIDNKTGTLVVKDESKANLKALIKRLYSYTDWSIIKSDYPLTNNHLNY
jgi:hypothetical protein